MVRTLLTISTVLFCLLSALPAQGVKAPTQVKTWLRYRPEVVTDDAGLQQWKPYEQTACTGCKGRPEVECAFCARGKPENCPECEGDKKSHCRECQGSGKSFDPLVMMPCPGCSGARVVPCAVCGARGGMKINGSGDRINECKSCNGHRGHDCAVCKGKGLVPTVKPTKPIAVAELKHLKAALAAIEKTRTNIEEARPKMQLNKLIKSYEAALKPVKKILPAAKSMAKFYKSILKDEEKGGGGFTAWEGNLNEIVRVWNERALWALDYSKELLEIAVQRAEANAAVEAAQKK